MKLLHRECYQSLMEGSVDLPPWDVSREIRAPCGPSEIGRWSWPESSVRHSTCRTSVHLTPYQAHLSAVTHSTRHRERVQSIIHVNSVIGMLDYFWGLSRLGFDCSFSSYRRCSLILSSIICIIVRRKELEIRIGSSINTPQKCAHWPVNQWKMLRNCSTINSRIAQRMRKLTATCLHVADGILRKSRKIWWKNLWKMWWQDGEKDARLRKRERVKPACGCVSPVWRVAAPPCCAAAMLTARPSGHSPRAEVSPPLSPTESSPIIIHTEH